MLDSPAPAKNAPISEGGSQQSGEALEEWGTSAGSDRNTMWSSLPSSGESLMELRSLANGDEDLESFFSDDSTPAPQSATTDVGPDINQFENFGDYLTAVVDHAKAGGADKKNFLAGVDVPNVGSGSNSIESDGIKVQ